MATLSAESQRSGEQRTLVDTRRADSLHSHPGGTSVGRSEPLERPYGPTTRSLYLVHSLASKTRRLANETCLSVKNESL